MGGFFRYRQCWLLPISSQPLRPPCPLLLWLLVPTFNVLFGSKVDKRQNLGGTPDGMALDSDGKHDLRIVWMVAHHSHGIWVCRLLQRSARRHVGCTKRHGIGSRRLYHHRRHLRYRRFGLQTQQPTITFNRNTPQGIAVFLCSISSTILPPFHHYCRENRLLIPMLCIMLSQPSEHLNT